jgi:TetR/AcrR family transcriptional repressor of lmrAB and yxaGH operons
MPRRTDARERTIRTAAHLFQQQGYHGTGLNQILEESGSPRGSFYFHFPGGKEELAVEVIRETSREVEAAIEAASRKARDPAAFVRKLGQFLSRWFEESDFTEGCPVAVMSLETTPDAPALHAACREAYDRWVGLTADVLRRKGGSRPEAERLATLILCAFEGALALGRARSSTAPFDEVARELAECLRLASPARQG